MERKAWITAARMVQKHGVSAVTVIESKLEKMRRDGVDEDHFRRWCWVARAVIEIIREPFDAKLCIEAPCCAARTVRVVRARG